MEFITYTIDLFLHLDKHLDSLIQDYGAWTYGILFTIIFLETGVVFTPFLPGDSLIFASGALANRGALDPWLLFLLLSAAAVLGDTVNYAIGKHLGAFLLRRHSRFFKPEHLDRTHAFFEKYGGMTIIIARFVPIVRTFAPFVAGMGAMTYTKFLLYNVIGGVAWVFLCTFAGLLFGQLPVVRDNFSLVVLVIILISVLPIAVEFLRHRRAARADRTRADRTQTPAAIPGDAGSTDA